MSGHSRREGEGESPRCATAAAARHLAGGRPAERGKREAARHVEPGSPAAGAHVHAQRREAAAFGTRRSAATSGERGRWREEGEATGASFASAVGKRDFLRPRPFAVRYSNHDMRLVFRYGPLKTVSRPVSDGRQWRPGAGRCAPRGGPRRLVYLCFCRWLVYGA